MKNAEGFDFTARLGGDEFGVLIWNKAAIHRLEDVLAAAWTHVTRPFQTSIGPVDLGASIGCALSSEGLSDHSKLMHAADVAMIRAKSDGGGVALFDPELDAGMFESAGIERAFRHAVRDGDVRAALQPIKCVSGQNHQKVRTLGPLGET